MITLSKKFQDEASRAGSRPTAVIEFVKAFLSAEAAFASHWNNPLTPPSNIAVVGNEVHLAKTLATVGASNPRAAGDTNVFLVVGGKAGPIEFGGSVLADGGFVFTNRAWVYYQAFKPVHSGYLEKIIIPFVRIQGTNRSTGFLAITDANLDEQIIEGTETTPFQSDSASPAEAVFTDKQILLQAGQSYKIFLTQTVPETPSTSGLSNDVISAFARAGNPYPDGSLRYALDVGPSQFDFGAAIGQDFDLCFDVIMQNRYQSSGSISIKLDLGLTPADPGEWVLEDIRDDGSSISYQAWSSATGAFAGEETSLETIVDGQTIADLKQYYKVTATLTPSADNLSSPKVLKIKANFDQLDRYCLKDSPLEYQGDPFPPIVVGVPQLQYQMDVLEGKASISKVAIDVLDDGILEEAIVNYYLRNNEIVIYIGFDADGWGFEDYLDLWRGNIVSWRRRPGVITLECSDWAVLAKKEIPVEYHNPADPNDPLNGTLIPLAYDAHPVDIIQDLLQNKINLRDSQIHAGSFDAAKASVQLAGWKLIRTISKPVDAWKLIAEIGQLAGLVLIPREDGKLFVYLFDPGAAHSAEFGDHDVRLRSAAFDARMDDTLANQAIVYYGFHIPLALTGSATWTHNSPTVTGSGTSFLQQLAVGMEIQGPDGRLYLIKSIESDTQFSMEKVYAGGTVSGIAVKRPRTDDEGKPSSYQGAVVVSNADSILNYKQTITRRILPSPWLGPDDVMYAGKVRAAAIAARLVDWTKDGIAYTSLITGLEFLGLQVGDFIRLGSRTTLPRDLLGFTWTKWVLAQKAIDFKGSQIRWSMQKVPSGTAFSAQLRAYSEWLAAATNVTNLVISQWPTEVILRFVDTEKSDRLDALSEWNAYESATNLLIEA